MVTLPLERLWNLIHFISLHKEDEILICHASKERIQNNKGSVVLSSECCKRRYFMHIENVGGFHKIKQSMNINVKDIFFP